MTVRRASCGSCARAVSALLYLSAAACGGSSSTPGKASPETPAPYVVASASAQSATAGASFSVTVAVPNAVAAGLGASTNVSVYPNAACSGAPAATQALAIDAGAGTATITGLTVPGGTADGTSVTWCASVPGPGGAPATATFAFTSYAAPSGTLAFTANGMATLSQAAGAAVSLSISGVLAGAGWSSTLNGVARGNGAVAFPSVTASTVFTLLVTNPAGAQYATSATLTATPAFGAFTADRAALTVSTPATVTFAATFLPGGNGSGGGTVTASESVFGCPAACTPTLAIASGQPVATTVTPGASAGTLTFTLSAGGASAAAQATIQVLAAASGATLVAADPILTDGSSTTLSFTLGTGTAGTITSDADPTLRVAVSSGGGPLTVSPTSTTIYTLTPVNGAGAAGAGIAATVAVVPRATLGIAPSAMNVTSGDSLALTVTDLNAAASQTGSRTVTLWQGGNGDCVFGSIAGSAALSSGVATFFPLVGSGTSTGSPLKLCASIPNVTGAASTASTTVTVWSAPSIMTFTSSATQGGTVTFAAVFAAPGVVSGTILDDAGLQAVPLVNSGIVTSPVTNARSTTYTLVASNKAGRWTSASVRVLAANPVLASLGTTTARFDATATRLLDGRVLLAGGAASEGGIALGTAVLYDPLAETFTPAGTMVSRRRNHTAHLLSNGTVLLIGGFDETGAPLNGLEVFDPAGNGGAGTFSAVLTSGGTGSGLLTAHAAHTSTVLGNGQILVAGGCATAACSSASVKAELLTVTGPTSAATSAAGDMNAAHVNHTATLLGAAATARVLVAGGSASLAGGGTDFAELYDPVANGFSCVGTSCVSRTPMVAARARHAAVLLGPGLVALLGGLDATPVALRSVETFDLSANAGRGGFALGAAQLSTARFALTAALLGGTGRLVAGGGFSAGTAGTTALDLYSVSGTTLTAVPSVDPLPAAMGGHGMVVDGTAALFVGAAPQAAALYSSQ